MLIACHDCHRQYDVGSLAAGSKVRCFCGAMNKVPVAVPRDARMLHCSGCGGPLVEGATRCQYCACEVMLGERGLGELCPECFARMVKGARYCSACGVGIHPQMVQRSLLSHECPRCSGQLASCEGGEVTYAECTACGGVWLEEDAFRRFLDARDIKVLRPSSQAGLKRPVGERVADSEQVTYIRCPVCRQHMQRRNFGVKSGVIIDWCGGHGFWFDTHELERIMVFVQAGGLEEGRRIEALRDTAVSRAKANAQPPGVLDRLNQPVGSRNNLFINVLDVIGEVVTAWLR